MLQYLNYAIFFLINGFIYVNTFFNQDFNSCQKTDNFNVFFRPQLKFLNCQICSSIDLQ